MKLLVLVSLVGACAAGALNSAYLPPVQRFNQQSAPAFQQSGAAFQQSGAAFQQAGTAFQQAAAYSQSGFESSRPRAALERNAAILKLDSDVTDQGFRYAYETENGIRAEESAQEADGIQSQGGYSYTGDDGQVYSVSYAAGANGFQPQGSHLPTAPPVPEEILKALEENARDEAAGIYDDGTYHEGKYADEAQAQGGVVAARTRPNAFAQQTNAFAQQSSAFAGQTNAFAGQTNSFARQSFGGKVSAPSREYLTPKGNSGYRY